MSDVVKKAQKRASRCHDYWSMIYTKAREDLSFLSDDPQAQWNAVDYNRRVQRGKPVLSVDQLKQFVNQVSNDARMNTPNITVIPHAGGADVETAEIMQGIVKDIEYYSNADSAYDLAVNFAIKCSLGYIRVDHKYVDDDSFDQELCIKRVPFPLSVYLDPNSTEIDGSDARYGFVFEDLSVEDFKERYPDDAPVSFNADWHKENMPISDDEIRIAEYFEIVDEMGVIATDDGREREVVVSTKVMRYLLSGDAVLESGVFPGKYIPIVPVYGEECYEDGKRGYSSLIRKSKDAQRRYNYWVSTEADLLMRAPKGMFLAAEGTTEDYADDYLDSDKSMVVRYKTEGADGNPAPAPQYIPPPQIPTGIVNAMRNSLEDIKSTMGLYNAFLGQQSNEVSGIAINARKQEGDRAVFHFTDNLTKSINQVGNIIVHAMKDVYDTPRIVKMVSKEGKDKNIGINGARVEGQERDYYITEGVYNVRVVTGPNFATQRQQAADFYQKILQTNVDLMPLIGDLAFEHMDFPGAVQIANRLRKTMDPKLFMDDDVDPQVAAMQQQNQELQQVLQQMQGELASLQKELQDKRDEIQVKLLAEQNDAEADAQKAQIEVEKMRIEERKIELEYQNKQAEIAIKAKELQLKEYEAELRASQQVLQSSGMQQTQEQT